MVAMHNKSIRALLLFLILGYVFPANAQHKSKITVEDIWASGKFSARSVYGVNWMRDGRYYSSLQPDEQNKTNDIVQYDVTTGQVVATLVEGENLIPKGQTQAITFDNYEFTADEKKILFSTETEPIYRHSTRANYYVLDRGSKQLTQLSGGGKQQYATISPDGSQVAFMRDNNLFVVNMASGAEKQITTTGKANEIIHGGADWVYEEEFSITRMFSWSPDNKRIAFISFDEREVPEFNMQMWGDLYPQDYRYKYPKAGEKNSVVSVSIYDMASGKTTPVNIGNETDIYIPRISWTQNPNVLSIRRMNRLQNKLEILHADAATGKTEVIYTENSPTYIDIHEGADKDVIYLPNGKEFVLTSERDGYRHLYLYNLNGKLVRQVTKGNWEIADLIGLDHKTGTFYFTSTEVSPLERHLVSINLKGKNKKQLTIGSGTHNINMSPDFTYYLDYFSNVKTPVTVSLHSLPAGKQIKVLQDNAKLRETLSGLDLGTHEFIKIKTQDGTELNGWMIKPANFDASKKYPVLMHVYGGPGSQTVTNSWGGANFMWHNMLAQQGYIVVSVDNRGTGARGANFKKSTYANLGKYETEDQIAAAKWLGNQPYVDKGRIGIWGWSFGGYMTLLGLTKGDGVFKAGIAVAPVTNWRFYDTIYTERFLKRPQDNAAGYDDNSPVTFANQLKGNLLMVHGTGDDNVHFQNAVAMQDALIAANIPFDSFFYPNRNHGIYGGKTRLHLYTKMTDFVLKNL